MWGVNIILTRLQKADEDTNNLIDAFRDYLFSVGIRTSRERAWDIFKTSFKLPFELLVRKNETIKYQGPGAHISHKHGDQLLVIKNVGKFELKGVSMKKDQKKRAAIKFVPSADVREMVEQVVVVE